MWTWIGTLLIACTAAVVGSTVSAVFKFRAKNGKSLKIDRSEPPESDAHEMTTRADSRYDRTVIVILVLQSVFAILVVVGVFFNNRNSTQARASAARLRTIVAHVSYGRFGDDIKRGVSKYLATHLDTTLLSAQRRLPKDIVGRARLAEVDNAIILASLEDAIGSQEAQEQIHKLLLEEYLAFVNTQLQKEATTFAPFMNEALQEWIATDADSKLVEKAISTILSDKRLCAELLFAHIHKDSDQESWVRQRAALDDSVIRVVGSALNEGRTEVLRLVEKNDS